MKADPYLKEARSAVEAFEAGIASMEAALKEVWELMGLAVKAGFSPTPYVILTERCDDMREKSSDGDLEAEVAESWKH